MEMCWGDYCLLLAGARFHQAVTICDPDTPLGFDEEHTQCAEAVARLIGALDQLADAFGGDALGSLNVLRSVAAELHRGLISANRHGAENLMASRAEAQRRLQAAVASVERPTALTSERERGAVWFHYGIVLADSDFDDGWYFNQAEGLEAIEALLAVSHNDLLPPEIPSDDAATDLAWPDAWTGGDAWFGVEVALERLQQSVDTTIADRAPAAAIEGPRSAEQFVPTQLQRQILDALDGTALKKEPLAAALQLGDPSRLYKPGGIKELRDEKLVDHKRGVGYFRPGAPPPEAISQSAD